MEFPNKPKSYIRTKFAIYLYTRWGLCRHCNLTLADFSVDALQLLDWILYVKKQMLRKPEYEI